MLAISTSSCPGEEIYEMSAMLEERGFGDVGMEIFYDVLPTYDVPTLKKRLSRLTDNRLFSFHYPMENVPLMDADGPAYRAGLARLEQSLRLARELNVGSMVIHASLYHNGAPPEQWADMRRLWRERWPVWRDLAVKYGVEFWIENSGAPFYGDELFTQAQYTELIQTIPGAASLIDIGHANICDWDLPVAVNDLRAKIKGYHLHNNNGAEDGHRPLREGTLNYDSFLRTAGRNALMVLEYGRWTFERLDFIIDELNWLRTDYGF